MVDIPGKDPNAILARNWDQMESALVQIFFRSSIYRCGTLRHQLDNDIRVTPRFIPNHPTLPGIAAVYL